MPSDSASQPPRLPRRVTLSIPESKEDGQPHGYNKASGKGTQCTATEKEEVFENGMKLVVHDTDKEKVGKYNLGGK